MKLLLAEELREGLHFAFNAFYEQETGGARETEAGFSMAASMTVIDRKLSLGIELNFESVSDSGSRGEPSDELLVGPSLQWLITDRIHLDVVPLFGLTDSSPTAQIFIVVGIELRKAAGKRGRPPTSTRGR